MKGNKGITLIALVITIIVLLILAGVAIAMLSGDNSILKNASKSADYNKIGEIQDKLALKVNEYVMAYLDHKYNGTAYTTYSDTNINTDLGSVSSETGAVTAAIARIATEYGTDVVNHDTTNKKVTITSNGYSVTGNYTDTGAVTWGTIS